jgi:U3 small nucleolar RNA-associated protein 4
MSFADDMLQIFDVESRQFPSWSQPLSDLLPKRLTHAHDPILGITFDPSTAKDDLSQALVWSSSWMCNVRLDDSSCANRSTRKRRRGNRKHSTADSSITLPSSIPNDDTEAITTGQPQELKIITRYRPNLYIDFIGPGELVVVERPLVDVLATLPPAYFKHKYGSS